MFEGTKENKYQKFRKARLYLEATQTNHTTFINFFFLLNKNIWLGTVGGEMKNKMQSISTYDSITTQPMNSLARRSEKKFNKKQTKRRINEYLLM